MINEDISSILKKLSTEYPDVKCHLEHKNPFQLLVSTVLAAQCTDERVNKVMIPLYQKEYREPKDILNDGLSNFEDKIKSINFYKNKAKAIIGICRKIVDEYNGKVPSTMDELTSFNGVGRKSASVILGNSFAHNNVIIVDTHLKRVCNRLNLTVNELPVKIEIDLKKIIPDDSQFLFSMQIGEHGRVICKAKKPDCSNCIFNEICPSRI